MLSRSSELLSSPVASAFDCTKLLKANMVYLALSERVVTTDLLLDHSAYSMGPTRYHKQPGESKPFRFMSPDCILDPTLEPYECKRSDILPVICLLKTDSGVKQGLTYIIGILPKTQEMLKLFRS
jgi:hypothetical protein